MEKMAKKKPINYKETRLVLQFPKDLKAQIRAEAKRKHLSLNSLIRLVLGEWVDEQALKHRLYREEK